MKVVGQSGFTTLPLALLLEQLAVVRCWRGLGLSSLQLWMKHGGLEDLCGPGRQSITPYVHGLSCCIECVLC
jgi:hypothetical protein